MLLCLQYCVCSTLSSKPAHAAVIGVHSQPVAATPLRYHCVHMAVLLADVLHVLLCVKLNVYSSYKVLLLTAAATTTTARCSLHSMLNKPPHCLAALVCAVISRISTPVTMRAYAGAVGSHVHACFKPLPCASAARRSVLLMTTAKDATSK
jgi:hypothetical protein